MIRTLLVAFLFFSPSVVFASVTINEVAWMGSETSANHEWIELYNSGPAVDLSGWRVTNDDSLEILLAGTLAGNSYAVLERSSDDSAAGAAFLIYTGSLRNTGDTLYVYRSDGGLEDQVGGGDNWANIGGDNTTKATAQYTTNGWITAEGTPGTHNELKAEIVAVSADVETGGSARLAEPAVRPEDNQELVLPDISLKLDINAPKQGFVNQTINFEVEPSGVGTTIQNSLNFMWNFGDTNTATGKDVEHVFMYPGTYIINIHGEYARQNAIGRHEITILPVAVSLTQNKSNDIQINNNSPYEIDLSQYRLRGEDVFEFQDHSSLLAGQTITVPRSMIAYNRGAMVGLYDTAGVLVASIMPSVQKEKIAPEIQQSNQYIGNIVAPSAFQFKSTEVVTADATATEKIVADPFLSEPTSEANSNSWPFGAMIALLIVTIIGILLKPLSKSESLE